MGVTLRPFLQNGCVHYLRNGCQSRLPQSPSFSTVSQEPGVQKPRRAGGGGYVGLVAVTAAVAIVGGSFYTMTKTQLPNANSVSQPVPLTAADKDHNLPASSPPTLSAHDELLNRRGDLLNELAALRKQKRDKLVDLKKKEIKEEICIIESGLAELHKSIRSQNST